MIDYAILTEEIDAVLTQSAAEFLETVPYASHLNDDAPLDERYYLRHRIETIKRIRGTAKTDALALAAMVDEDYDAAREWSQYANEELRHDVLFQTDLAEHGVTADMIARTEPFPATRELLRYLTERITELGSLPAVAYSVLVEWNSERYSGKAVRKATAAFSETHTTKSREHYEIDQIEDHLSAMIEVARRVLIAKGYETGVLLQLIDDIAHLLREYFTELHNETVMGSVAVD